MRVPHPGWRVCGAGGERRRPPPAALPLLLLLLLLMLMLMLLLLLARVVVELVLSTAGAPPPPLPLLPLLLLLCCCWYWDVCGACGEHVALAAAVTATEPSAPCHRGWLFLAAAGVACCLSPAGTSGAHVQVWWVDLPKYACWQPACQHATT